MRPISSEQVQSLLTAKQHFRDCYMVSSLHALAQTQRGRRIIQENVKTDGDAFCIKFNDVQGKVEEYIVTQQECDDLILVNEFLEPIPLLVPHNPIIKAFEVAMNKLLKLHPDKKPLSSRLLDTSEKFEYNKPSNFMKMFTGIKPIVINEGSLKNSMKKDKNAAKFILDELAKRQEQGFVLGTGFKFLPIRLASWHCYNIDSINTINESVLLRDNKLQTTLRQSYDDIYSKFKFICGYFEETLK